MSKTVFETILIFEIITMYENSYSFDEYLLKVFYWMSREESIFRNTHVFFPASDSNKQLLQHYIS